MGIGVWFAALTGGKKVLVVIGVIIALLAVIAAIILGVNAHDNAVREGGRNEIRAAWNAETAERQRVKAQFTTELSALLGPRFDHLAELINGIETGAARINVELPRALAADPRYRDPNCNLTAPVLDQANAARRLAAGAPK
jgi:hypothetical protein